MAPITSVGSPTYIDSNLSEMTSASGKARTGYDH